MLKNAKALADALQERGYKLVTGGTELHLLLVDLRSKDIDGARVEKVLEKAHITLNKNTVPGDLKPLVPSGVRIGTPALTSRGMVEADFVRVAEFLDRGVKIAQEINKEPGASAKVVNFTSALEQEGKWPQIQKLREDVNKFAGAFSMPGEEVI